MKKDWYNALGWGIIIAIGVFFWLVSARIVFNIFESIRHNKELKVQFANDMERAGFKCVADGNKREWIK